MKINKNFIGYFKTNQDTKFVKYFYGISTGEDDIQDFKEYSKTVLLKNKGLPSSKISKILNSSKSKIDKWVYCENKPFIIRLLEHYLDLGKPKNNSKWLSINSTRGGLFTGPWIMVPNKISSYNNLTFVTRQLNEISVFKEKVKTLGIFSDSLKREYLFAYLFGFFIGDSSKTGIKRKQRMVRRIQVRLSKGYGTNEKVGEFVSLCANQLGLRMGRRKDCPAGKRNVHPFYTWVSQSSLLIQWILNVSLGLKDDELTTYNPVRADWILGAPKKFKIHFIQGIADSDGFVDFSSKRVGIITEPNTELMKKIFDSLNVKTKSWLITRTNLWILMMSAKDAYSLPVFNQYLTTYRFEEMKKLFKAKRVSGHWPLWLKNKIDLNIKTGLRGTALVKKIIDEEGIAITTKGIRRRIKRLGL